jgi:toxin ParE1/3/4
MIHPIFYHPLAQDDLDSLYDFIAAYDPETAIRYVRRIQAFCESLGHLPRKGRKRDDLGRNVRVLTFERRVMIAYRIEAMQIIVLRVLYAGRNIAPDLMP